MQEEIDRLKTNETALQPEIDHLRAENREHQLHSGKRTTPAA